MNFEDLTPEQKERAKVCKTPEDILALAKSEGYTLTDEELDAAAVGGGACWCNCTKDCDGYGTCPNYYDGYH